VCVCVCVCARVRAHEAGLFSILRKRGSYCPTYHGPEKRTPTFWKCAGLQSTAFECEGLCLVHTVVHFKRIRAALGAERQSWGPRVGGLLVDSLRTSSLKDREGGVFPEDGRRGEVGGEGKGEGGGGPSLHAGKLVKQGNGRGVPVAHQGPRVVVAHHPPVPGLWPHTECTSNMRVRLTT
jgi:hypothetical protein